MIPVFFRRYKKAHLANLVSYLGTFCFIGAIYCSVGYFMNWEGLRDQGMSMGECLAIAAACAVAGFLCWKLAAWMANRKYQKLAAKEAASRPAATPDSYAALKSPATPGPSVTAPPAARYCRKCGAKAEPDDAYCVQCGAKL